LPRVIGIGRSGKKKKKVAIYIKRIDHLQTSICQMFLTSPQKMVYDTLTDHWIPITETEISFFMHVCFETGDGEAKVLVISVITNLENLFADILCTTDTNVGILPLSSNSYCRSLRDDKTIHNELQFLE